MKSSWVGSLLMLAVLIFSLDSGKAHILLNWHSIILVLGGTFAVLALSSPGRDLRQIIKVWVGSRQVGESDAEIRKSLVALSQKRSSAVSARHPLLSYARELWEQGVDDRLFKSLMIQRLDEIHHQQERVIAVLRNLSKYPPALGMTGTVIGMVSLFSELHGDQKDRIGVNLALAMTATFYGLVLSNAVLMPIADRFQVWSLGESQRNERLIQVLLMIQENQPTHLIEERLNDSQAA